VGRQPEAQLISTANAVRGVNTCLGYEPTRQTIVDWCARHGLGRKIGDRWFIDLDPWTPCYGASWQEVAGVNDLDFFRYRTGCELGSEFFHPECLNNVRT